MDSLERDSSEESPDEVAFYQVTDNVTDRSVGVTAKQLQKLAERQQYKCAITGWELTPDTASPDHIVPISQGGTHAIENLQIVHAKVNVCKGALLMRDFLEVCRAVVNNCSGPSPT